MAQVRSEQNDRALLLEVADQGNARRFAAWIDFDFNILHIAVSPIFQDNGERMQAIDRALPAVNSCRARAGRHGISGFFVLLNTKTEFMRLLALENR
jgi:hypothetical protein